MNLFSGMHLFPVLLFILHTTLLTSGQQFWDYGILDLFKKWFTLKKQGGYTRVNGNLVKHSDYKSITLESFIPHLGSIYNQQFTPPPPQIKSNNFENSEPANEISRNYATNSNDYQNQHYSPPLSPQMVMTPSNQYQDSGNNYYHDNYNNVNNQPHQYDPTNYNNIQQSHFYENQYKPTAVAGQQQFYSSSESQMSQIEENNKNVKNTGEMQTNYYFATTPPTTTYLNYPSPPTSVQVQVQSHEVKKERNVNYTKVQGHGSQPNAISSKSPSESEKGDAEKDKVKAVTTKTEITTTEKAFSIEEDFPCPQQGTWIYDKNLCIAIGVYPGWACKPTDLVMNGRIAYCRNKHIIFNH